MNRAKSLHQHPHAFSQVKMLYNTPAAVLMHLIPIKMHVEDIFDIVMCRECIHLKSCMMHINSQHDIEKRFFSLIKGLVARETEWRGGWRGIEMHLIKH